MAVLAAVPAVLAVLRNSVRVGGANAGDRLHSLFFLFFFLARILL
jgi:hypothetical protein